LASIGSTGGTTAGRTAASAVEVRLRVGVAAVEGRVRVVIAAAGSWLVEAESGKKHRAIHRAKTAGKTAGKRRADS
jgi:hypothetical protein